MARKFQKTKGNMKDMLQKAREEAAKNKRSFGEMIPIDPGRYTFQLVGVQKIDGDHESIMLTYCVVDDEDNDGALCKAFFNFDSPERSAWAFTELERLGTEQDAIDSIQDVADFIPIFEEHIEARTCAIGQVRQKDDYKNLFIRQPVEVDESVTWDPEDALKQTSDDETAGEGDEEPAWRKGDRVAVDYDGQRYNGTIKKIADGVATVEFDDETEEDIDCDDLQDVDPDAEASNEPEHKFSVGDRVKMDYEDEWILGEVSSTPPNTTKVQVTWDDFEDPEMVEAADLSIADGESEESEESEESSSEFVKGDKVVVEIDGEDQSGVVDSIDGDDIIVKIGRKKHTVAADEVFFDVD